jgi:hypothetical protein
MSKLSSNQLQEYNDNGYVAPMKKVIYNLKTYGLINNYIFSLNI